MYFSPWLLGSCLPLAQALPGCKRAQTPSPTPPCATRSRSPRAPPLPPYSRRARSNLMYLRPLAKGGWNRPAPLKTARGEGQTGAQQHTTDRRDTQSPASCARRYRDLNPPFSYRPVAGRVFHALRIPSYS